ncbi:hypothetical protein LQW54_013082 [Pestalotiopsis sp. IQ-011]
MADKLPVEIWAKIALIIGPARIPTDVFPRGHYQSIKAEYAKWKSSRDDLLRLSLTSKSLAALCRPILWKSFAIADLKHAFVLPKLLNEHPQLRQLIKELYYLIYVHEEQFKNNPSIWRHVFPMEKTFRLLAPNLQDILYTHNFMGPNLVLCSIPDLLNMKQLKSLRLRPGVMPSGNGTFIMPTDVFNILPSLPSIKTVELCLNHPNVAGWNAIYDSSYQLSHEPYQGTVSYPRLDHLRHLRLHNSYIRERQLADLVFACPSLQTLLVHFEEGESKVRFCATWDDAPENEDAASLWSAWKSENPARSLNEALLSVAGTLSSLELLGPAYCHFLVEPSTSDNPRDHRLTCLPQLTNLKYLMVDFRGLFGSVPYLEPCDAHEFPKRLPPSLRTLMLVCDFGNVEHPHFSFHDLEVMARALREMCLVPAASSLRSIGIAYDVPIPDLRVKRKKLLEDLQMKYRARNAEVYLIPRPFKRQKRRLRLNDRPAYEQKRAVARDALEVLPPHVIGFLDIGFLDTK